jgi:hypothetical protein
LINTHDVVGFEAEHGLVQYNLEAYNDLIQEIVYTNLCQKPEYPDNLFSMSDDFTNTMGTNLVWDV